MDPLPCDMVLHTTSCKLESELEKKKGGNVQGLELGGQNGIQVVDLFFCFLPPPLQTCVARRTGTITEGNQLRSSRRRQSEINVFASRVAGSPPETGWASNGMEIRMYGKESVNVYAYVRQVSACKFVCVKVVCSLIVLMDR